MSSSDKLLTVIVPSYNMEEYLPKCLDSLIVSDESLFRQLDVIVVNDGSKDRTSEIAHDFEKRYPGVFRVIDKANGHYGSCINMALPEVQGFFVRVLDADDYVETNAFAMFLDRLDVERSTAEVVPDLIVADYSMVGPQGEVLSRVSYQFIPENTIIFADEMPSVASRFMPHSITYRSAVFSRLDYRQTEGLPYTDTEWVIEPMVAVSRVIRYPLDIVRYLVGRDGQSCDPSTYVSNFNIHVEIAEGMVSRFDKRREQSEPHAYGNYTRMLISLLFYLFESCQFGLRRANTIFRHRLNVSLSPLDEKIRQSDILFKLTESARYPSTHFPVRLIWAWRRHPGVGTPTIIAFWLFLRLRYMAQIVRAIFQF